MPTAIDVNADILNKYALDYAFNNEDVALKQVCACHTLPRWSPQVELSGLAAIVSDAIATGMLHRVFAIFVQYRFYTLKTSNYCLERVDALIPPRELRGT